MTLGARKVLDSSLFAGQGLCQEILEGVAVGLPGDIMLFLPTHSITDFPVLGFFASCMQAKSYHFEAKTHVPMIPS